MKPDVLKGIRTVTKRRWKRYQAFLEQTTPLERAEYYARQMESRKARSVAALARALGEPMMTVWKHLRLLMLPTPIREFLREHRTPQHVRHFSERKLLELVRIQDARAQWRRFREMAREAEDLAGICRATSEDQQ